jgi:hypothetical protein
LRHYRSIVLLVIDGLGHGYLTRAGAGGASLSKVKTDAAGLYEPRFAQVVVHGGLSEQELYVPLVVTSC